MNGDEPAGTEAPAVPLEGSGAPAIEPENPEANFVITTIVDDDVDDDDDQIELLRPSTPPAVDHAAVNHAVVDHTGQNAMADRLAEVLQRLAPLEDLAKQVGVLRLATGQELERCAGVLLSHDRGLRELNDRLADLAGRAATVEGQEAARTRVAGIEERLAALDPLPAVVQALRVVVRADEDLLAAEVAAREDAAKGPGPLDEVTGRLAAMEARVAPLESTPDDVAALGRIVRRELDAVITDVQAREQVLRRALQKEIERLQTASQDRQEVVGETEHRLELIERRLRGTAQATEDAVAATTRRLEAIDGRLASVDGLAGDLDTLRAGVRRELERLRVVTQSHDQAIADTGKRFAALDGRLTRFDALPAEVQSLRSAVRQGGERAMVALRSVEERTVELTDKGFRQLRQLADSVTQAHERSTRIAAELQSTKAAMRSMEVALAETTERLDTLAAALAARHDADGGAPDPAPPQGEAAAPAE